MRRRRVPIVMEPADLHGGDLVQLVRWASKGCIVDDQPDGDAPEAMLVPSVGALWSRLRAYEEPEVAASRGRAGQGRPPGWHAATRPKVTLDPYWPAHNEEHNARERELRGGPAKGRADREVAREAELEREHDHAAYRVACSVDGPERDAYLAVRRALWLECFRRDPVFAQRALESELAAARGDGTRSTVLAGLRATAAQVRRREAYNAYMRAYAVRRKSRG